MLGRSHAASGWCAGLLVATVTGHADPSALPIAAVAAGAALLPDLDHPRSTVSRFGGWITRIISWCLRTGSAALYQATKGPRDEDRSGGHRHLTHTALFAAAAGGVIVAATWLARGHSALAAATVVAVVVALAVALAAHVLTGWILPVAVLGGAVWWTTVPGPPLAVVADAAPAVGAAVAAGCVAHDLGDALTHYGCPILWPLPIRGETWYELGPPQALRFTTGGVVEQYVVFPGLVVAGGALAVNAVVPVFALPSP